MNLTMLEERTTRDEGKGAPGRVLSQFQVAAFILAVPANLPTCQPESVSPHQLRD